MGSFAARGSGRSILLRPFAETDINAVVALHNLMNPGRVVSSDDWCSADQRFDEGLYPRRRVVAQVEPQSQVIGYGCVWNIRAPRRYRLDLMVHPDWQRIGVGGAVLNRLLDELRELQAISLQARCSSEQVESLSFLFHRGFAEVHRMVALRLELADINLTNLTPLLNRVFASGVEITTLAEEQTGNSDWLVMLHTLEDAARVGWPDPHPGPPTPLRYEEFVQQFEQLNPIPEGFFVARTADQYLGYSGLSRHPEVSTYLNSANTAVHPDVRNRGLATALKVETIAYAKQQGYQAILTNTASEKMLAINQRLGFHTLSSEVRLVREL